ncbi:hypothetical protein ACLB2K_052417 [Fragaria x ananassa]
MNKHGPRNQKNGTAALIWRLHLSGSCCNHSTLRSRARFRQMAGEEESMEEIVAARKERLRALKAAQELLNTPDEDSAQLESNTNNDQEDKRDEAPDDVDENSTNMKFRNYVPHDKKLQEAKLEPPKPSKFEEPVAAVAPPSEKTEGCTEEA